MLQKLRNYYNYWRCWIISLFHHDSYLDRILELNKRILYLSEKTSFHLSDFKTESFVSENSELTINTFQPIASTQELPSLVSVYREREQLRNSLADYIGMCNEAIKKKKYKEATSLLKQIVDIQESLTLDEQTINRIKNLQAKYNKFKKKHK